MRHVSCGSETDEQQAEDFVCCEVPVGGDAAMALDVLYPARARRGGVAGYGEAGAGRMFPRAAQGYAGGSTNKAACEAVVELVAYELAEMLEDSDAPYVLIDPPPVDKPIPGGLRIDAASDFVEVLRRRLELMKKGRV